jgi:hypothetical protein
MVEPFTALNLLPSIATLTSVNRPAARQSMMNRANNRDKNFTRAKMERRLAQIEESVARYLRQLDSADRQ